MKEQQIKILLSGGGTGGPVTPLLAIAEELRATSPVGKYNFLWLGTRGGVELEMVKKAGIIMKSIHAGKFRRYFSLKNVLDIFNIILGFFEAFLIIIKWRPKLVMSAGGFISVPVVWAGWLLRVPVIIHQQDVRPGLANRLMAPFSKVVTVTFEKSLNDYGQKAKLTGNPVRKKLIDAKRQFTKDECRKKFNLKDDLPTLLVLGGGSGASAINDLLINSLPELADSCQIIHLTGKGKAVNKVPAKNYKQFEFLNTDEIAMAYLAADLAVSRCGMGTLTELSFLGIPAILIPMPASHQEENAKVFHEANAAILLDQKKISPELFTKIIKKSINDKSLLKELSINTNKVLRSDANKEMATIIRQQFDK